MGEPTPELPYMPDYGVAADAWEPLPWSWAAERLAGGRNYWVVTVSAAGQPHALPVWGVWDDTEHRFAFSCGPRARKVRDIAANPCVAVAVDDTVEVVSLEGRAEVVTEPSRREEWARRLVTKYRPVSPEYDAAFVLENLVIEVTPERGFGVIEREEEFSRRPTRWRFAP